MNTLENTYLRTLLPRATHRSGDVPAFAAPMDLSLSALIYRGVQVSERLLTRAVTRVRSRSRRRETIRALSALDDSVLKDIGVPRARIPEVVDRVLADRGTVLGAGNEAAAAPGIAVAAAPARNPEPRRWRDAA